MTIKQENVHILNCVSCRAYGRDFDHGGRRKAIANPSANPNTQHPEIASTPVPGTPAPPQAAPHPCRRVICSHMSRARASP